MKIGILLVDFSPGRMGGVETYVRNLIHHLVALDTENSYTLICHDGNADYFADLEGRVTFKVFANHKKSPYRLARSLLRKVSGIDLIQVAVDRLGLELLHNPFTAVRSSRFKTPVIVTFHDLQHRYLPHFFKPREVQGRDAAYSRAAREAIHLIAVSKYTADTVSVSYNVPLEKITVVPLGVAPEYRPYNPDDLAAFRHEHALTRPFLYFPAASWPHKNHATLFEAFSKLLKNPSFDGDLVLTGVATRSRVALVEKIKQLGIDNRIRILGYLPYKELPHIYCMARLMVFPSLFEGFGMPVLEAMACGCPVVCSNVTSLPEVAGEAAGYFNPVSPEEIAASISKLWNDDNALSVMREKGIARAELFSWEKTALKTREIYMQTAGQYRKV